MAPLLGMLVANGFNLIADAVMNKGKEVIQEKLGIDIETAVKSPEGLQKLRQAELDHEEFLITAALENRKLDIQEKQLAIGDVQNARDSNVKIQESQFASSLAKNVPYYLDIFIIVSTMLLAAMLFFKAIPPENKEIAFTAFGALLAWCGTIINFHRSSSAGSKGKDDSNNKLLDMLRSKS